MRIAALILFSPTGIAKGVDKIFFLTPFPLFFANAAAAAKGLLSKKNNIDIDIVDQASSIPNSHSGSNPRQTSQLTQEARKAHLSRSRPEPIDFTIQ